MFVQYSGGHRSRVAPVAASDEELTDLIRSIAARGGIEERRFDRSSPRVCVPLPGGGRLFAVQAVTGRPCVAIRRDRLPRAGLRELVRNGTVGRAARRVPGRAGEGPQEPADLRRHRGREDDACCGRWPARSRRDERLITIEDSLELCLDWDTAAHPDVVAMQSREPNTEGEGEITLAELVRWALRMTPDRVLVGEVRGAEVIPMLNAMSQGNDGSMTTIHASSSRGAMLKLAAYAAQSAGAPDPGGHRAADRRGDPLRDPARLGHQRDAVRVQHPGDHRRRRPAGRLQRGLGSRPGPPRRPGRPGPRRHHGGTRRRRLPARTVAGGVSAATAGILGALAGLGVVLVFCRAAPQPARPSRARA